MNKATIQFLQGIDERVIPEIRLLKSKDARIGEAVFTFHKPYILLEKNCKEIKGMSLIDEEGQITITEINIAVSKKDGTYTALQAIYSWTSDQEFNRFMRFANRYAENNGLVYEEQDNLN
mgnify:CR=1 FL=1|tara:strand:+ start:916 stop:1275 length:360 start_codon:yes stop_codon:yes gene_type:complete